MIHLAYFRKKRVSYKANMMKKNKTLWNILFIVLFVAIVISYVLGIKELGLVLVNAFIIGQMMIMYDKKDKVFNYVVIGGLILADVLALVTWFNR